MTPVPSHSGRCERCDGLIIDARCAASVVRLDAEPVADGAYRAYLSFDGATWRANPSNLHEDSFLGLRRREHVCVLRDKQLEIGAA